MSNPVRVDDWLGLKERIVFLMGSLYWGNTFLFFPFFSFVVGSVAKIRAYAGLFPRTVGL